MKKTLKILILTLLISFGFLTNLKADTEYKTLNCKYRRYYKGDSASKYNFDFSIEFKARQDLNNVGYKLSQNEVTVGDKTFNLEIANGTTSKGYSIIIWGKNISEQVLNGTCPTIYFSEEEKENKNDILIFPTSGVSGYTTLALTNLDSNGNDPNLINSGDKREKICQLKTDRVTIQEKFKTLNKDDYDKNHAYTIDIITREDNVVFIRFNDGKKYSDKHMVASTTASNYAWEQKIDDVSTSIFSNAKFVLKNGDVDRLKELVKFDNSSCPELYLEQSKTSKSYFYITFEKTENSIAISEDFTIENSEVSNKLAKDLGFFKDLVISDEISGCMAYVGEDLAAMLQTVYTVIKVVAIILTIVMSMLDLSKTITNGKKDELMSTIKKWVNRLIIVLVILLLPTFIDIIGNIAGKEDILCGIR